MHDKQHHNTARRDENYGQKKTRDLSETAPPHQHVGGTEQSLKAVSFDARHRGRRAGHQDEALCPSTPSSSRAPTARKEDTIA
ncbi:hypothetical protein GCM10022198_02510 [Klugiella xanthotipulae]